MVSLVQPKARKTRQPKTAGQQAAEQQAISAPTAVAAPSPPRAPPPPQPPVATQQPIANPPQPPVGPSAQAPVVPPAPLPAQQQPPANAPPPPVPVVQPSIGMEGSSPLLDELAAQYGASPPPTAQGQQPPSDFNEAAQQLLLQQLQNALNGADTAEEEALIRQQMEDAIGQQLVDARASMGRAGFGGGTLAALEGDIMRQTRQQSLEDILGLRRTEGQRAIDNALSAIGSDIDLRKQAEDEFFTSSYLDALRSYLGMDPVAVDEGGPFSGGSWIPDPGIGSSETPVDTGSGYSTDDPIIVDAPPDGAVDIGNGIWRVTSGKRSDGSPINRYYRVGE